MEQLIEQANRQVQELAPDVSSVVIEEAVRERAPVRLRSCDANGHGEVAGRITDGDDTLIVEVNTSADSIGVLFAAESLEARIIVAGLWYEFPARCIRPASATDSRIVYLVRPETIWSVQRRRNRRYRFEQPATMTLLFGEPSTECDCALLNLSPDGVACRVREVDAQRTAVGRHLHIHLRIGPESEVFDFTGCVVNITQAGTTGDVIVGIEFTPGDETGFTRERLQELLNELHGPGTGTLPDRGPMP